MLAEVNSAVFLRLQIPDRLTDRGIRARVYNSANSEMTALGSPFTLSHVANGLYTNNSLIPTVEGFYSIRYEIYTDGTFGTIDPSYSWAEEDLEVRSIDQDLFTLVNAAISSWSVPETLLLPDSGTKTYKMTFRIVSGSGATKDPDSNLVNITITDTAGGTVLSQTAMTRDAAGRYSYNYTVNSTDTVRALVVIFDYTISAVAAQRRAVTQTASVQQTVDAIRTDYTTARAAKIDNLDATISSRATDAHVLAIPTNPLLTSDSRLNNLDAAISTRATDAHVLAIPTNPLLTNDARLNNLDATISSRATDAHVLAIPTNPLLTNDARLNNLDATISSRATDAHVLAIPTNPLLTNDVRLNDLDAAISSRAPAATAVSNADYTSARAAKLDDLDVAVSSRLATGSYVAPDNAGIASIESAVAAIPTNPLLTSDSRLNNLDAAISSVKNIVWDEPLSGHLTAGSAGKYLSDAGGAASPETIAEAVWDEDLTGHNVANSAGVALKNINMEVDPGAIADAVWDEDLTAHVGANSAAVDLKTRSSQTSVDSKASQASVDALTAVVNLAPDLEGTVE